MNKIGIVICYCDFEIASSLDLDSITAVLQKVQGVSFARSFKGLFDTSNQDVLTALIKKEEPDGVVVAGGGEITLTATGYKVKGRRRVDLVWTGRMEAGAHIRASSAPGMPRA